MTLSEVLGALEPTVLGPQCSVCKLLGVLSGEDRQAVLDVLSNELVSGRAIEAALRREGLRVGAGSANRHRRGDCRAGTA